MKFSIGILSYTDSWYLVHFSSNISCKLRTKKCLCFEYSITASKLCRQVTWSGIHRKNSYTKQAFRKRLPVTATLCRVNEASQRYACGLGKCWANEIRSSAKHFSIRKWVSRLAWKQTEESSKDYRMSINCYSWRAYAQNLVKWPERESDHKTLYNVEITCEAIILSLYMTVRGI